MTRSEWLGVRAAAERLGVVERTVYRLIDQNELTAYRIGRVIRIKSQDLDQYLKQAQITPGSIRHLYPD